MEDLISIIIPIYNGESFLLNSIKSVEQQTYPNLEIILVDDGSTDSSEKIIREYITQPNRVKFKFRKLKENSGQTTARNVGLSICTGEYVIFLDADDTINPEMIEKMYKLLKDGSEMSMCSFYRKRNGITKSLNIDGKIGTYKKEVLFHQLFDTLPINWLSCIGTKMYRMRIIRDNDIIFSDRYRYNEDLGFVVDYLEFVTKVSVSMEELYCYNYTVGSTQHKRKYRPNSIQTVCVAREEIKKTLIHMHLWDEKKGEYSYSILQIFFSSLLCDWDNFSEFNQIYMEVSTRRNYLAGLSDAKNMKAEFRIFAYLFVKKHARLLYLYMKSLQGIKNTRRS